MKTEYEFKLMCYLDHTNASIRCYIKWIRKNKYPYQLPSFYESLKNYLVIRKRQIIELNNIKNQTFQLKLNL
jgi:hypothetical protein